MLPSPSLFLIFLMVKGVSKDCTAALINHNLVVILVVRVVIYTWVVVRVGQLLINVKVFDLGTDIAYCSLVIVARTSD